MWTHCIGPQVGVPAGNCGGMCRKDYSPHEPGSQESRQGLSSLSSSKGSSSVPEENPYTSPPEGPTTSPQHCSWDQAFNAGAFGDTP